MADRRSTSLCAACNRFAACTERVQVRSNVRAFRSERFWMWRCEQCGSINAEDPVALEHYYKHYPFHDLPADGRIRAMHENQLRRLRGAGLEPSHHVLDYGCGDGALVRFLRTAGYEHTQGFDAYSTGFSDTSALQKKYDLIVCQDCIEHVESPLALLGALDDLTRPGGAIVIGTPEASAIDLRQPERYVHTLHAPYHRHILSRQALVAACEQRGWRLERWYSTMYSNTRVPFLNERFYRYYLDVTDDVLDTLMEPVRAAPLLLRLPLTLFYGLFGSLLSRHTDVTAVFRKG